MGNRSFPDLEPFSGSLWGKDQDNHPLAAQWLEPGQSRLYEIEIQGAYRLDRD